jgi:predicted transcriptional regulator
MLTKKWTGDLVGLMHNHKISKTELANELGVTREYVSMVLNEHRAPAGAKERFESAVDRLIDKNQGHPEQSSL